MNTSTIQGEDAVTDDQVAAETSQIKTAEALNTPVDPVAPPVEAKAAPEPVKEPEKPRPTSLSDDRNAIFKERTERRRAAEAAENGAKPVKPEILVETTVSDDVQSQTTPDVNLPSNLRRRADGEFVVVQKVNGVEQEVLYSKLHADAQKVAAAGKVFQEKAALQKKYDELLARSSTQPSSDAVRKAPSPDEQQVVSRETLNKAFIEDDDTASQTILDRLNRNAPQVDKEQWINEANQRTKFELKQEMAFEAVSSDPQYGEFNRQILDDPKLRDIANDYSAQLQESEPHLDATGNIARALQLTRERFAAFAPPIATDALAARTAAKLAHTQVNQPVGATQRQPLPTTQPVTPVSTRDRMRAQRIANG